MDEESDYSSIKGSDSSDDEDTWSALNKSWRTVSCAGQSRSACSSPSTYSTAEENFTDEEEIEEINHSWRDEPGEINEMDKTVMEVRKMTEMSLTSKNEEAKVDEVDSKIDEVTGTIREAIRELENVKKILPHHLSRIINFFKKDNVEGFEIDRILDSMLEQQNRSDFQWVLYQLGGLETLILLFARIVELCPKGDLIHSKAVALILNQIKQFEQEDENFADKYNVIRLILASDQCYFGYRTFLTIIQSCLTPSGKKIIDFEIIIQCILLNWKKLIRVRCCDIEDAPTGKVCLFEVLLSILTDLVKEENPNRDYNRACLRSTGILKFIICICTCIISDYDEDTNIGFVFSFEESVKIAGMLSAFLIEMMSPPDPDVTLLVYFSGLYPLLPEKICPLPTPGESPYIFHMFHSKRKKHSSLSRHISSGKEVLEVNLDTNRESEVKSPEGDFTSSKIAQTTDTPELLGRVDSPFLNTFGGKNTPNLEDTCISPRLLFRQKIIISYFSILINCLGIMPDSVFKKLKEFSPHLFVAYCSYPEPEVKKVAIKALSAFLSRSGDGVTREFYTRRGFYLTGLYIKDCPEIEDIAISICKGFGPTSFSLLIPLLKRPQAIKYVLNLICTDPATFVPTLISSGIIQSLYSHFESADKSTKALTRVAKSIIQYCVHSSKKEVWISFTKVMERAPFRHELTGLIYFESLEQLRRPFSEVMEPKPISKLSNSEGAARIMYIIQRCCAFRFSSYYYHQLVLLIGDIMDENTQECSELWKHFAKKNRKKCMKLYCFVLCQVFSVRNKDNSFKMSVAEVLMRRFSNQKKWLPTVCKVSDDLERCLTGLLRIFLTKTNVQPNGFLKGRSSSFHKLIKNEIDVTKKQPVRSKSKPSSLITESVDDSEILKDFELFLVSLAIISPLNNFIEPLIDFVHYKTTASRTNGVTHEELKACMTIMENFRVHLINVSSESSVPSGGGDEEVFEEIYDFASDILNQAITLKILKGMDTVKLLSTETLDLQGYSSIHVMSIMLGHPKAVWHFPEYWKRCFCTLDLAEGPGRIRVRIKRMHKYAVPERFILPEFRTGDSDLQEIIPFRIFKKYKGDKNSSIVPNITEKPFDYLKSCILIRQGMEIPGEIILESQMLHFIPDEYLTAQERVACNINSMCSVLKRRYLLEHRAVELFEVGRSLFFVFPNEQTRNEFMSSLALSMEKYCDPEKDKRIWEMNPFLGISSTSLSIVTAWWVKGKLSNYDYLMYLNTCAGRTYSDLMQYPVYPFVISKYESHTLDLLTPESYRDLKKPIAVQDPSREHHFRTTYEIVKKEGRSCSLPYHYGSHYSNAGIVLYYLIRLQPYTQEFLKYQDGAFDLPDRSFHSIETTWKLASKESNTDFKETIPEFFYLPEMFKNVNHLNLGVKQNGQKVDDVQLPHWCKNDPRIFVLVLRQALESNHSRKNLSDWIDLIFGYKQTGKDAVDSCNVFHPSTYEGFDVKAENDEILEKANRTMVATYGQTPKQLFRKPHPRSFATSRENCNIEVIDTVWGIKWGAVLGSPTCSAINIINTKTYKHLMRLFDTPKNVLVWPENSILMDAVVVGHWDASGIQIKSTVLYVCRNDEITACSSVRTATKSVIWIGHRSGRITVLELNFELNQVTKTIELTGHLEPIEIIDLNEEFLIGITSSGSNYALIWDINTTTFLNSVEITGKIDQVQSSKQTGDIVLLSKATHQVVLASINGDIIGAKKFPGEDSLTSVCISNVDPGSNVNLIAVGSETGVVSFYSTWNFKYVNEVKLPLSSVLPVTSLMYTRNGRTLYCALKQNEGHLVCALQNSQG